SSAWPLAERDGDTATALEPPCDSTRIVMPVLRIVFRSADSVAAALASPARLIAGRPAAACRSALLARAGEAPAGACSPAPGTAVGGGGVIDPAGVVEHRRCRGERVLGAGLRQLELQVLQELQVGQLAAATAAELPGQEVADGHGVLRLPRGRAVGAGQPECLAEHEE